MKIFDKKSNRIVDTDNETGPDIGPVTPGLIIQNIPESQIEPSDESIAAVVPKLSMVVPPRNGMMQVTFTCNYYGKKLYKAGEKAMVPYRLYKDLLKMKAIK